MIDYDKLKIATDLADKLSKTDGYYHVRIRMIYTGYSALSNDVRFNLEIHNTQNDDASIDNATLTDIITKLKELTEPKPKYEVGQQIWFIDCEDEISNFKIDRITRDSYDNHAIYHCDEQRWFLNESAELYPTREALIEGQIEYWQSLKIESISSSKICPKCGMQRLADGMCWAKECGYKDMWPPFQGEIKGFNYSEVKR